MTSPLELLTVSEAARRIGSVRNTLAREIARHGIQPDGILIEGGKQRRSPLFVESRLKELRQLATKVAIVALLALVVSVKPAGAQEARLYTIGSLNGGTM